MTADERWDPIRSNPPSSARGISRVSRVETFSTFGGVRNWIFVRIHTDDGLYGWGEASTELWDHTVLAAIGELGGRLLGMDALASESAWQQLHRHGFWRGGAIASTALAAIDQALWDIRGKRLGVPVYRLLGGPTRQWVRTYRHVGIYRPEAIATDAEQLVREGVRMMKTGAWVGDSVLGETERVRRFADNFAALRDLVGPEVDLVIDNHGRSRPDEAIRLIRAIAPYRPLWIEEPISPESPELVRAVAWEARLHGISMALGERLYSRSDAKNVLEAQLVDVLQPDLCHAGGITEVIKMAAFADVYRCVIAPHNPGGPVSTAAAAHVAMATPNFLVLEFCPDEPRRSQITVDPWRYEGDRLWVPDSPGLGVDLDIDALLETPAQQIAVPSTAFALDGSVADI